MEKAVFALKPKEVSEPIKANGYYVFTVDEARTTTLEEATPQIRSQLAQKNLEGALDKVKQDFVIKFNDDYFAPPESAPKTPGPTPQPEKNPKD